MLKLLSSCFLLILSSVSFAQEDKGLSIIDSINVLPPVIITSESLREKFVGERTEDWDSTQLRQLSKKHLGDLLSGESGIYIKSYGGGGLATTSIRGGNAGHTSIIWNGLPLQSPMLGIMDISFLPLSFYDQVTLQYGGNSAAWGSGAIGGSISLRNLPATREGISLTSRTMVGSFSSFDQNLKFQFHKGCWSTTTRAFYTKVKNDFAYRVGAGFPDKTQSHAANQQRGILQEIYWTPTQSNQFSLHIWLQDSDREIPPTTVQSYSAASQKDKIVRTAIHWKSIANNAVWHARAGVFREHLDYRDDRILLHAVSSFWTVTSELETEWILNQSQRLHTGIGCTRMQADADNYKDPPVQSRIAPFISFRQNFGNWLIQINGRQEVVDGKLAPFVPGFGIDGKLTKWLDLKAKLTRNYRLPTFNDLYWQPGGNPDLLPESGWSQEATLRVFHQKNNTQWHYSMTGFNRTINNWILWSIREGQSLWSSNNITKVRSRGIEQRLSFSSSEIKFKIHITGGYDYILSTNVIEVQNPKLGVGDQLIYVPKHKAFLNAGIAWNKLDFQYQHQYTGSVETINTGTLPGYQIGNMYLNYLLNTRKWQVSFFLQLENLWNSDYRVIERQPMPGTSFKAGFHIDFSKFKKTNNYGV